jgi:archaellum component FlaC
MAKDKIDHLTEVVKLGFGNLDTRIERGFAAIVDDIEDLDHKIMSLRATTETGFLSLRDELQEINECLNALDENYKHLRGVKKEIDDIRTRVKDIERHLGIGKKIAA